MRNKIKISFVLLLSLLILFGFFSASFVFADDPNDTGTCKTEDGGKGHIIITVRSNCPKTGPNKGVFEATPIMGTCTIVNAEGKAIPTQMTEQRCKEAKNNLPPGAIWKGWVIDPAYKGVAGENSDNYQLLQPLPCKSGSSENCVEDPNHPGQYIVKSIDVSSSCDRTEKLSEYVNFLITIFIALCAVAAVVMIVIGGIQYSTSELLGGKEEARSRILNAIFGLVLALGAYAILYTINPDLLKIKIDDCPQQNSTTTESVAQIKLVNTSSEEVQYKTNIPSEEVSGLLDPGICDTASIGGFLSYFIKPVYAFYASAEFCNIIDKNGGIDVLSDCGSALAASNALKQEGVDIAPEILQAVYLNETAGGKFLSGTFAGSYDSHMKEEELNALARLIETSASFREAYKIFKIPSNKQELDEAVNTIPVSKCALYNRNLGPREGNFHGHGGALGKTQIMPTTLLRAGGGNPEKTFDAMVLTGRVLKEEMKDYNISNTDIKNLTCKYFSSCICGYTFNKASKKCVYTGKKTWVEDYGDRAFNYSNQVKPAFTSGKCNEAEAVSLPPETSNIANAIREGLGTHYNAFDEEVDANDGCLTAGSEQKLNWSVESLGPTLYNVKVKITVPAQIGYPVVRPGTQSVQGNNIVINLGDVSGGSKKSFQAVVRINNNAPGDTKVKFPGETTYSTSLATKPEVQTDLKEYRICKN